MIKIIIDKDKVNITTESEHTTGCTCEERELLLSVAESLAKGCKEGAE